MSLLPDTSRILIGPGPSLTSARVMRAMASPTLSHLDPVYLRLIDDLRTLSLAESGLKVAGNRHAVALLNVADAHFALGNKQKALEFGARAVLAAENESPALRRSIGLQVQTYEAKRKTSSKDDE